MKCPQLAHLIYEIKKKKLKKRRRRKSNLSLSIERQHFNGMRTLRRSIGKVDCSTLRPEASILLSQTTIGHPDTQ